MVAVSSWEAIFTMCVFVWCVHVCANHVCAEAVGEDIRCPVLLPCFILLKCGLTEPGAGSQRASMVFPTILLSAAKVIQVCYYN